MQKTFLVHRRSKDSFFLTGLLRKNRIISVQSLLFCFSCCFHESNFGFHVTADRYRIATRCGLESPVKKWNAGLVAY